MRQEGSLPVPKDRFAAGKSIFCLTEHVEGIRTKIWELDMTYRERVGGLRLPGKQAF